MPIRTKWTDPDFRREPKTLRYCLICQRDLKPGQPHRIVRYELDKFEAIHTEDWELAEQEIPPRWAECRQHDCIQDHPIGMDCARKLGLEWSREPK